MSDELKIAIEAAKKGAEAALRYYEKKIAFEVKPDNSPVTKADKEAEDIIKKTIVSHFPNSQFLGEETGGTLDADDSWCIDPIDGTKNFIRGLPFWGIEIAHIIDGKIVLGLSYGPVIDEMLYAEKGKGAFMNGKPIKVSKIAKLEDAFLNHGTVMFFEEKIPQFLKLLEVMYRERGFGDFYGYHLVAQGKSDIMMDAHNAPWDIAAVKIIIEEAGGRVTNFKGEPWSLNDTNTLATNGLVHDEVIRILNQKI